MQYGWSAFQYIVILSICLFSTHALADDLRLQLRDLAVQHGFIIKHLDRVDAAPAKLVMGDLDQQLKELLGEHNYVVSYNADKRIDSIEILNRISPDYQDSRGHTISSLRYGMHQIVQAVLVGPGDVRLISSLVVDTGASTIVLPESMIAELGMADNKLRDTWVQTANGKVKAKMGILNSVEIGTALVNNVAVTFVPDDRLGNQKLLGMSFLKHFQVTLDEVNNELILLSD
jgi:aspartyl protease family protein